MAYQLGSSPQHFLRAGSLAILLFQGVLAETPPVFESCHATHAAAVLNDRSASLADLLQYAHFSRRVTVHVTYLHTCTTGSCCPAFWHLGRALVSHCVMKLAGL